LRLREAQIQQADSALRLSFVTRLFDPQAPAPQTQNGPPHIPAGRFVARDCATVRLLK